MKKVRRLLLFFCYVSLMLIPVGLFCQTYPLPLHNNPLERNHGKIAAIQNSRTEIYRLNNEQINYLLSDDQYVLYKKAHNCYTASVPFLALSGCGVTISTVWLFMGIHASATWKYNPGRETVSMDGLFYILSGITMAATLLPLSTGILLHVYGVKNLNRIVLNYNTQHNLSNRQVKLNIGLVNNGIGFQLIF
ncbi:MAG: hypothetical protein LBQ64_03450 [Bacteroidales bacterium]|jgi:hypothetical protein|nr:hypothetical protein [Bacteroidales bacterium]